jgi:DUF4097 and DUF4098 domain-containing protein YvlB
MTRYAIALALLAGWLPATAGADEFRQAIPVQPGGSLEVDLSSGSVEVETHDEHEVAVDAESRGLSGGLTRFELSGDGVNAKFVGKHSGWLGMFGSGELRVRVRVPESYSIDVRTGGGSVEIDELGGRASVRTSGGSIELVEARGPVELETSGGPIRVEEVEGDVTARTSGGRIQISEVAGRVEARTSGGSIDAHEVDGPVEARTSGGSISVRFNDAPEGDLRTSGGSIEVEFSEDAALELEAETSGGRVQIDSEIRVVGVLGRDQVKGQVNGGGAQLRLKTSGGNIRVRVR